MSPASGEWSPANNSGANMTEVAQYDGLGRATASYVSYDLGETSYADAGTVSGDTVIQQSEVVRRSVRPDRISVQ